VFYWTAWWLMAAPLVIMPWLAWTRPGAWHETMNIDLGLWGTWILAFSLAISPAAELLHRPGLIRYRRTLGLFAFAYSMVHALDYALYAHIWQGNMRFWSRRLYIVVGIAAGLAMIPLAISSADALRRRMGPRAWRALHSWVYAIAGLVVLHSLWEGPIDYTQQWMVSIVIGLLLALRLPPVKRALQPVRPGPAA
jgi:sulfoxide reductase heme-binding subunit YedZ